MLAPSLKLFFVIIPTLLLQSITYSQAVKVAMDGGYGRSGIGENSANALSDGGSDQFQLNTAITYFPFKNSIFFSSGLGYEGTSYNRVQLPFLKIPFVAGLNPGKRVKAILDAGFNLSFLLKHFVFDSNFINKQGNVQIEGVLNLGLDYQIFSKFSVFLKANYEADLTRLYTGSEYTPGGGFFPIAIRLYSISLNAGLTYSLF